MWLCAPVCLCFLHSKSMHSPTHLPTHPIICSRLFSCAPIYHRLAVSATFCHHLPRSSTFHRGLFSSLDLEPGLENFWYPAAFSAKLLPDTMVPIELFNETWVLFRDQDGKPACVRDECAHRACPLSLGRVVDGQIECPYHGGWVGHGLGWVLGKCVRVACFDVGCVWQDMRTKCFHPINSMSDVCIPLAAYPTYVLHTPYRLAVQWCWGLHKNALHPLLQGCDRHQLALQ